MLAYQKLKKEASLRAAASQFYNHRDTQNKLFRIREVKPFSFLFSQLQLIDPGTFRIRPDRWLYANSGVRHNVLNLITCYNPLYLRLALEVIYSEVFVIPGDLEHFLIKFIEEVCLISMAAN
jgi:hypothetical protein